jgi:hypothetical protein
MRMVEGLFGKSFEKLEGNWQVNSQHDAASGGLARLDLPSATGLDRPDETRSLSGDGGVS